MSEPPRVDPAVLERLRKMVGQETFERIVELFRQRAPEIVTAVRDGVDAGNLGEAARALHSLCSSAGMLGAGEVERLAREMEPLARNGRAAELEPLVGRLEAALRRAAAEVSSRAPSPY